MLCYYHSYFLDEETSTGKLNICSEASTHPFESRALLIFLCLRAFALAIASTWIALSQESHVAPSLPLFRASLTLSYVSSQYSSLSTYFVYFVFISLGQSVSFLRTGALFDPLWHFQHLEQCLAQGRCLIPYLVNKWTISNDSWVKNHVFKDILTQ